MLPLAEPAQPRFPLMAQGGYYAMGGGARLTCEGQVIAGAGASGGSVDYDVAILEAVLGAENGGYFAAGA